MTLERVEAAIAKLERLRDAATPVLWLVVIRVIGRFDRRGNDDRD